jgi:hypothetical protein
LVRLGKVRLRFLVLLLLRLSLTDLLRPSLRFRGHLLRRLELLLLLRDGARRRLRELLLDG